MFLCYNAGGMREGMKARAGVRLCSVHPQKGCLEQDKMPGNEVGKES